MLGFTQSRGVVNDDEAETTHLWDFLDEFAKGQKKSLITSEELWGNTWQHRPCDGQVDGIYARFESYRDQYEHAGRPMPWLDIANLALIGWIRDHHPEALVAVDE